MMLKRSWLTTAIVLILSTSAYAVPEMVSARVCDVTTSSLGLVWMTDVAATPEVEIYADASRSQNLDEQVRITPYAGVANAVQSVAQSKGIMQARISGLKPNTVYYVRGISRDPNAANNYSASELLEVKTASEVNADKRLEDNSLAYAANDLLTFETYIRPSSTGALPGLGDLLLLETEYSPYPLSAFVGVGSVAPEGLVDLNNLFDWDGVSLDLNGGETAQLRVYRGETLSTLLHYRRFADDTDTGVAQQPVRGFFADFNLDGQVDAADFELFKAHYRSKADDGTFNPDINLIEKQQGVVVADDQIDARDFARFATEYGNQNAQ